MSNIPEVPTDDLLSFQDYSGTQTTSIDSNTYAESKINISENKAIYNESLQEGNNDITGDLPVQKSFWTLEYYQQFFDVDRKDVLDRIIASMLPKRDNFIKNDIKRKPDVYGPFWIAITLVFTIAISGNIANYFQHANAQYHWKYDFHLVSYAATAIFMYVIIVPFSLWGLLIWSSEINDLDNLEENIKPKVLELVCIYGYSLFIYIPVSILWAIQIRWLQWLLAILAACMSGSVLLLTLLPSLRLSKYKLILIIGIIGCHTLLAAGFMLYFFHDPHSTVINNQVPSPALIMSKAANITG